MNTLSKNGVAAWLVDRHRGYVLLLVMAVLSLYLPYAGNPFFFDDIPFFSSEPAVEPWLDVLLRPRGLPYNTLQLTWQWFGNSLSHAYHLVDALLHAANAIALFYLLNTLTRLKFADRPRGELAWACALASLVFALNPVATYAAGYVIQRSILMATLFSLLAQLTWVKAWTTGRAGFALLTVLLYFLASFSKEHALALPAVLAATSLLLREKRRLSPAMLAACTCAAAGIALYLMFRRADVVGASYEPMSAQFFSKARIQATGWQLHVLSIATQAGLFFKYLFLWLIPVPAWMAIDIRVDFLPALSDWRVATSLLAYAAFGALNLWLLLRRGTLALVGLALLVPWLWFGVEFATVRVQEPFVLYRSYLWTPLLMLLPAMAAMRLLDASPRRGQQLVRWTLPLAFALCLGAAAANRLAMAADHWTLWDDAARLLKNDEVTGADRILYNRGQAAMGKGDRAGAVADLERAARMSPELWQVWQLLGAAHLANGQPQLAQQDFTRALQLSPGQGRLLYGRAIALRRNGKTQQAMADLQASCKASWMPACLIAARLQAEQAAAAK